MNYKPLNKWCVIDVLRALLLQYSIAILNALPLGFEINVLKLRSVYRKFMTHVSSSIIPAYIKTQISH